MREGTIWEDRVIGIVGLIGSIILIAFLSYEVGHADGVESVPACVPKVVKGTYSTEELYRMIRARKRMETIK